jgi:CheY-like chemotaxis protein
MAHFSHTNAICSGVEPLAEAVRKILCIEDDREIADLIAEELTERGYEVSLAYSGPEGLMAIMKATPDLVLCDVSTPSMTGFEVLQRLDEIAPRFGRIPFIFLTALADRNTDLREGSSAPTTMLASRSISRGLHH